MNIGVKIEDINILTNEKVLNKLYNLKVKHLEIQIKSCDKNSIFFTEKFSEDLLKLKLMYDFNFSFHSTLGLNYIEKINRVRETTFDILIDMLKLCSRVDAKWLTIHIGECGAGVEKLKERINIFIKEINELYKKINLKIILALENMPQIKNNTLVGNNINDIIYILNNTSNTKMLFDIGHYEISDKINITKFADNIIGAHIHDNDGKNDKHLKLGEGIIDFSSILKKILVSNKDIPIILEYRVFNIVEVEESIRYLQELEKNKLNV